MFILSYKHVLRLVTNFLYTMTILDLTTPRVSKILFLERQGKRTTLPL